jgi:predicted nucleotidyltransferase
VKEINIQDKINKRFKPFLDEVLKIYKDTLHSISIFGSALTDDYNPKSSDINSVFVLNMMDLNFLKRFAPLGKKYGKKRIASPLIMTPEYIKSSLDVFPVEFFNLKLLHSTVYGEDIFRDLEIGAADLRHQCERELKSRLIALRQGYLSSLGNRKILTRSFVDSFSGYIPLFRSIIFLLGQKAPANSADVLATLQDAAGMNTGAFQMVLNIKTKSIKPTGDKLNSIFEEYYKAVEQLGDITDDIQV